MRSNRNLVPCPSVRHLCRVPAPVFPCNPMIFAKMFPPHPKHLAPACRSVVTSHLQSSTERSSPALAVGGTVRGEEAHDFIVQCTAHLIAASERCGRNLSSSLICCSQARRGTCILPFRS